MFEQMTYIGYDNVIFKSDPKDKWTIYLEASNENADADDEMVIMKALEDQAKSYLKKGVISWDHLHKKEKDPKYIIGEPLDVKFTGDGQTLIKAKLYKKNEYAQSIVNMLESGSTRLGASIGGAILSKSKSFSKKLNRIIPVINKLKWDEVAITYKPVNEGTLGSCSFYPFGEFSKSFILDFGGNIEKALEVGSGVDASKFTGGRSLISESLGTQITDKGFWNDILTKVCKQEIVDYKSLRKHLSDKGIKNDVDVNHIASIFASKKDKFLEKIK